MILALLPPGTCAISRSMYIHRHDIFMFCDSVDLGFPLRLFLSNL